MKTYKIFYLSGDGKTYEHGEYVLIENEKTLKFNLIKQGYFYSAHLPNGGLVYRKSKGYTLEKLQEVFYPQRRGVPHWIE